MTVASPSPKSGCCHSPLPNEGMKLSSVRIPCILRHKTGQPVTKEVIKHVYKEVVNVVLEGCRSISKAK